MQDLNRRTYKTKLDDKEVEIEISDIAKQTNGSVIAKYGDTEVLAVAVMADEDTSKPFFPLRVDYEERFYAVGEILGSRFVRREGRPSEEATLSARLIDRTIRPLFDPRMRRETQIMITILSYDEEHDLDTVSMLASSLALSISDIPWDGPVAGVRFGLDGTPPEDSGGDGYEAFFAGPGDVINMIELGGEEISEEEAVDMFEDAQKKIQKLVDFQNEIVNKEGKEKQEIDYPEADAESKKVVDRFLKEELDKAIEEGDIYGLEDNLENALQEKDKDKDAIRAATALFNKKAKDEFRSRIVEEKTRPDGRDFDEVRPLYSEVDLLARTHGSALFARGDTQSLSVATLAPPGAKKLVEGMEISGDKRFMLHYNFPEFSVGKPGFPRGPGRREIGHGALAAKAIRPFIPPKTEFPYTLRVVAETLSSNGSTSMAATCSASMSLMDAGVNLKSHVAGVAMGLVEDGEGGWEILTDIQGPEDHFGEMDLKVAGTREGINAMQMDVKRRGITKEMFERALPQAKKGRLKILDIMEEAIAEPREETSPYAPKIVTVQIKPDKIGALIGPGGKTINNIIETVGEDEVTIDIEDDGSVFVSGSSEEYTDKAVAMVEEVTKEYEKGEVVEGEVVKVLDFGAIVEFGLNGSGLVHVSNLSDEYVENVEDVVKKGDKVKVEILKIENNGKIKLALKD